MATIKTIPDEERYLHLYDTKAEFDADYDGDVYHEDWVSYIIETEEVHYNKMLVMSVQELIDNGYAEELIDSAQTGYTVIQIHQNCPVKLENITDFDEQLVSSKTFVWREALPQGWSPAELAAKYDGVALARPPMEQMFSGVDMGSVDELSLSFASATWFRNDSSILTNRNIIGLTYQPTPKHVIVTIRSGEQSSVFQTSFSNFRTTEHITFNAGGGFGCHDIVGMFEYDYELTQLTFNGRWYGWTSRWDGGCLAWMAVFDNCSKLVEIPLLNSDLARNHEYNYIYPHRYSGDWDRGMATLTNTFRACTALQSIKPTINMLAINGADSNAFNCPNLTDVRILNLNNRSFDFTSSDYYIPRMDVASIQYLLSNVSAQKATEQGLLLYYTDSTKTETTTTATEYPVPNNNTITLNDLHRSEIAQSYIDSAAAKGWTVVWNHVNL